MVNSLTEETPNTEREIWTTAATMYRYPVNYISPRFQMLLIDVKYVANFSLQKPQNCFSAIQVVQPLTVLEKLFLNTKGNSTQMFLHFSEPLCFYFSWG